MSFALLLFPPHLLIIPDILTHILHTYFTLYQNNRSTLTFRFVGLSGLSQQLSSKQDCSKALEPGSYRHRICHQKFAGMQSIKRGTQMSYKQCVRLFRMRHWNCSALQPRKTTDSPFGDALKGLWIIQFYLYDLHHCQANSSAYMYQRMTFFFAPL